MLSILLQSLFSNHSLQPENITPSIHLGNKQYVISWLIVACFASLVWIATTDRKKLSLLISAALSNRNVEQLIRKEYAISNRLSIVLSIVFVFICTLLIHQTNNHFGWLKTNETNPNLLYLKISGVVFLFFLVKMVLIRATGFIFERENETFLHVFNIFLFNEVTGLLLFPLVILARFSPAQAAEILLYVAVGLMALMYLIKFLRLLLFASDSHEISKIHLFLYLCTLEILPLVVVIKMFVSRI